MRRSFIALLAFAVSAFGQSGEWGSRGVGRRFVVRGEQIFAADGRGVAVYEVGQGGGGVRRAAVVETRAESLDLTFSSDRDLIVATRDGIDRYSVGADGSLTANGDHIDMAPTAVASNGHHVAAAVPDGVTIWTADLANVVSRFAIAQPVSRLAWHGETLIVGVPAIGIYLVDPTGSREPSIISENARDLAVSGDTLHVAAGVNGIASYDLSSDVAPRFLNRADAGDHNYAHVTATANRLIASEDPDAITVFAIDSTGPVLTNRFKEPVRVIAASGTRLFVSGTILDEWSLPTETGAPLRVFDLSNPATPQMTAEFRDLAGPVSGVATNGSLAYLVDRPYFRVIDISTTSSPRELSSILIDDIGDRVRVRGNQAITFGRTNVHLIDVSDPYAPKVLKVFRTRGGIPSAADFARNLIVEANQYSGFHVLDFANFAEPVQIGGVKQHFFDLTTDGSDVAYAVGWQVALDAIDIADPQTPRITQSFVIGPVYSEVASLTENHPQLLVVQTLSGVRVYSLADPRNPLETSFTPTALVNIIVAEDDAAYLARPGALDKMDLTNPMKPSVAATGIRPISPSQLAVKKGKLVIADRYSLRVFGPDTPPPPAPTPARRRASHR